MTGPVTRFAVLGPLEVWRGDEPVVVPAGRGRALLAALLLRAGQVVTVDELVERLWDGDRPNPQRSRATLHMVVARLRQALGDPTVVRTVTHGYVADVAPGALDLHEFRDLAARGRFAEALALWRGTPLSDVRSDVLHAEEVAPLLEERLTVLERRIDVDLEEGRAAELVPELRALTREHPLRERFWAMLVHALHRSGRTAEALAAYQEVRVLLAEELGVEPGEQLREAHRLALGAVPEPPGRVAAPRQLPADVRSFTGRRDEVAALDRLAAHARAATAVAITGMGGLGKTALAVHWAHRVAADFPDGQLMVNLRGYDQEFPPLTPEQALTQLLGALGVPAERVPAALDEQVALYRSVLADRRILVVLDNVADVAQVRPLLPPGAGNFAVLTGRNDLRGLVALDDAVLVRLNGLAPAEAVDLLRRVLGPDRVDAEPDAIAELVDLCAGLPLALRVAAATLAGEPRGVADYVTALQAGDGLSELEIPGDPASAVHSTFFLSYRALTPAAQRLFRLFGVAPCRDHTVETAAALAGMGLDEARRVLGELLRAHLLEQPRAGRFVLHDLLRLHAESTARSEGSAAEHDLAVTRLLDFYLHNIDRADRVIRPTRTELPLTPVDGAVPLLAFADQAEAVAWIDGEMPNLRLVIPYAGEHGRHEHAWQIPTALWGYLYRNYVWTEWRGFTEVALASARRLGNRFAEAVALHTLGGITRNMRPEEALDHLHQALAIREEIGHVHGMAASCLELAGAYESFGRHDEAVRFGERAVQLWAGSGNEPALAIALNNHAGTLSAAGRHEQALEVCLRAVELYRRLPGRLAPAVVEETLAQVLIGLGRLTDAAATYQRIFARGVGELNSLSAMRTHLNYADLLLRLGDPGTARVHLTHALELCVKAGFPQEAEIRARLAGGE
ncbi:DNA-binding SARP family transcriptional activator [Saccharothrix saharensis]|uniref:DNA-binding SARP family transcriptional activator n=1 Tax=Saccharothrix saharensis TaxID=571190 RepID=A0A543JIH8_9PSEU|nr:BTAD domain-containing putative transcriptional regulator [Saccharothrix saharensis]TQM82538.1 DNA-binding SARP family transcriptional activator [Saccharothrix saharensis]